MSKQLICGFMVCAAAVASGPAVGDSANRPPNFVVIFTDDQGYADLSCFGGKHVSTPRIDKMAAEGMKLASFYVAAAVCTPSRAALMTGCYPKRVDMARGSNFGVLLAGDSKGLSPEEITIAEVLKSAGYKTGMFGKWHLGDQPQFLPTRQGFDEFFGLPYSHDIHPYHSQQNRFNFPPLPLLDGETVIETDPDADYLTKRITERAVAFIKKHKGAPFFLYVPHPIPHRPLHASPPFMKDVGAAIKRKLAREGDSVDYKTRDKLYKQAIAEIDWSVGRILDTLKARGIDEHTLVIFTSDNGPRIGSARPLKGGKGSTFEGGMRMPTVVRWPGKIPAGRDNAELMTAMDLLPTFARLAGAEIPNDRVIDGKDVWPVLAGEAKSPHEAFFYHRGEDLEAVRSGPWKLHVRNGRPIALYNLEDDIGEQTDVRDGNQDVVRKLLAHIRAFEADIAKHSRPAAFARDPTPLSKSPVGATPAGEDESEPAPERPSLTSMRFSTQKVAGIGHEPGVCRRDPSDVIKVGDTYYVWYSKVMRGQRLYPSGYAASVWYATSTDDGQSWAEQGEAVGKGPKGTFDSHGVFTPNILAHGGKYYLYYTAVGSGFNNRGYSEQGKARIAVAVSGSPDGPWTKPENNIVIEPSKDKSRFDSFRCDDSALLVHAGKIWLYYKGRQWGRTPRFTKMGVAVATDPLGPFVKQNDGEPVQPEGHEVVIWTEGDGVVSLVTSAGRGVYYSRDRLRFKKIASEFTGKLMAPGAYRRDLTDPRDTSGLRWGIAMVPGKDPYLVRFVRAIGANTTAVGGIQSLSCWRHGPEQDRHW